MTNQTPAQQQQPPKADPKAAQFVVTLTPEQYESRLNQPPRVAPPPPQQMEVGGTGTAKVHFKDVHGAEVKIASVQWTSTGPVTVTADEKDQTTAKLTATASGRATVKATAQGERGASTETSAEIMVIETGTLVEGKIELSIQPPAKKAA